MAEEIATMVARLDADMTRFEKNINKAVGIANTRANAIEKRFLAMNNKVSKIDLGGVFSRSFGAIGAGLSLGAFQKFADTFTRIQNNLKVAGLSGDALTEAFDQLYTIAQRTGTPLEGLTELFGRVTAAQKNLGASSQELVGFTSIVASAIQVSGRSATEASGALLQLSQILGGARVEWEDYSSLIDGLRPLLEAAAAGLKEAGGDVSTLNRLVKDGKVSTQTFFRAIEAGSPILTQKLAGATATTAQGFTKLGNDLAVAAGKVDLAFDATRRFNSVLSLTGDYAKKAAEGVAAYSKSYEAFAANRIAQAEKDIVAQAKNNPALANLLQEFRPDLMPKPAYTTGGTMDGGAVNAAGQPLPSRAQLYRRDRPVVPVSINDAPVTGSAGGKAAKIDADVKAYEREVEAIKEKTEALRVEKENLTKSAYEQEKARVSQELMTAATKAYGANAAAMKPQIDAIAGAHAQMKVEVDQARESLEKQQQAMKDLASEAGSAAGDWLVDFKNGLMEAKSAADAARTATANMLNSMADQALRMAGNAAIMALFQMFGLLPANTPIAGSGGGIFSALFGGTRAGGGSVQPGRSFMVGENGPERFVPTSPGQIIPKSSGGGTVIDARTTIDARGADATAIARLERIGAERDAALRRDIPRLVSDHRRHGRM